jgi:hypothetical protein
MFFLVWYYGNFKLRLLSVNQIFSMVSFDITHIDFGLSALANHTRETLPKQA